MGYVILSWSVMLAALVHVGWWGQLHCPASLFLFSDKPSGEKASTFLGNCESFVLFLILLSCASCSFPPKNPTSSRVLSSDSFLQETLFMWLCVIAPYSCVLLMAFLLGNSAANFSRRVGKVSAFVSDPCPGRHAGCHSSGGRSEGPQPMGPGISYRFRSRRSQTCTTFGTKSSKCQQWTVGCSKYTQWTVEWI